MILSPIPCWEHLPAEEYRERIRGLVEEVEEEAAADRERTGIPVRGPEAILAQDQQYRPKKLARSPAPFVHAATKAARLAIYQSYSWFVEETAMSASRPVASHRPCLSCLVREGKPAGADVGYVRQVPSCGPQGWCVERSQFDGGGWRPWAPGRRKLGGIEG